MTKDELKKNRNWFNDSLRELKVSIDIKNRSLRARGLNEIDIMNYLRIMEQCYGDLMIELLKDSE